MSTLWKRPENGRYYIQYVDYGGKQKKIALKTTDKQIAKSLFDAWVKQVESKLLFKRIGLVAPAMRIEGLWQAYSTSMEAANRRANTLKQYRYSFTRFLEFVGPDKKLSSISAQTIEDFMLWLREQGAASSHCNKMRNELAGIFAWGGKRGYVEPGIFQTVAKFAVDKKDVLILSDDEITRLFIAADALDATGMGRGMGLFVRIGYYMGLQPGENCALRWDHVDFGQKIIRVSHDEATGFRVKMGKERAVKLYPAVADMMKARGAFGESTHGYGNTKDVAFRRHWERVKESAGLEGLKPKDLRKNFAFRFLQLTRSEQLTRVMMGHGRETETLVKHYLPQTMMFQKSSLWDPAWIEELKQF